MALDLMNFYKENKFKFDGKMAYGIYRNRLISIICKGPYVKYTISFNRQLTRETGAKLSAEITKIKQSNRVVQNGITTNVSLEMTLYHSADINQEFFRVLDATINAVNMYQDVACETCPMCGQVMSTNEPFIRIKDTAIQAHDSCITQLENANKGFTQGLAKYSKKGMKFAILFSILSLITFVGLTIAVSFSGYYSLIAPLTGWASYTLVQFVLAKLKVLPSKKIVITMAIFSLFTCLISIFVGLAFQLHYDFPEYTLMEVFSILNKETDIAKALLLDIAFGIFLLGTSVFFNLKRISLTQNSIKRL